MKNFKQPLNSNVFMIMILISFILSNLVSSQYAELTTTDGVCDLQYFFLKVQPGQLDHCVSFSPEFGQTEVCGWSSDNNANNLFNNNQGEEQDHHMGMGLADSPTNAITSVSFVQISGIDTMTGVQLSMNGLNSDPFEFKFYGSNDAGTCGAVVLGNGSNTIDFIPLSSNYVSYKYICVQALNTGQVLLSQIKFGCPPTSAPTKAPTFLPSLEPTSYPSSNPSMEPFTTMPLMSPTDIPSVEPSQFPLSRLPTPAPSVDPTPQPSAVPSTCHLHYYFLKIGELHKCEYNYFGYPSDVSLCAYSPSDATNSSGVILYNNNNGEETDAGMGISDTHYISGQDFLQIGGINTLHDVSLKMNGVGPGEGFIFYGTNQQGNPFSMKDNVVLGSGNENDKWVLLDPIYKQYTYVSVMSTSGDVLLSQIKFECETPTAFPSSVPVSSMPTKKPTFLPTMKPTKKPSLVPSAMPTDCHSQYYFFKIDMTDMTYCIPYHNGVTICGWNINNDHTNPNAILYNSNENPNEAYNGVGLWSTPDHGITTTSFIQIEGLQNLLKPGISMHSTTADACFVLSGTNEKGDIANDPSKTLGESCEEGVFIDLLKEYQNYQYVSVRANTSSVSVLLSELRFYCPTPAPSLKPTFTPTIHPTSKFPTSNPSFGPSFAPSSMPSSAIPSVQPSLSPSSRPTLLPTPCVRQYFFMKVGLGTTYQSTMSLGYYGNVDLFGYKNVDGVNTPWYLYSVDEGVQLDNGVGLKSDPDTKPDDPEANEIIVGTYIVIAGLQNLDDVQMSIGGVTEDDVWIFYGSFSKEIDTNDVEIVRGSKNGVFVPLEDKTNGISFKQFPYVKVTVLSGSALLQEIRLDCVSPSAEPTVTPSFVPSVVPTVSTRKPSYSPSYMPTHCYTQYFFNKLNIPTSGGNTTCVYYKPNVQVCGFDNSGVPMNLYSTYQSNLESSDEGLGLQMTTNHEIVSSTFIQLSGLQLLDSVSFDMHSVKGSEQFIFYGSNELGVRGDYSLGIGGNEYESHFFALNTEYKNYPYVSVTAVSEGYGVMLAELRYDCLNPTNSPTEAPVVPSIKPSMQPIICRTQYTFLQEGHNPLAPCHSYSAPGQTIELCGYNNDLDLGGPNITNLWSTNQGTEMEAGIGLEVIPNHAISDKSFVQISGLDLLLEVALDVHSMYADAEFLIYGSNTPYVIEEFIQRGTASMMMFDLDPSYRNYKYLFVTAAYPEKSVLLFQVGYRCTDTYTPTIAPTNTIFSFEPTWGSTTIPSFKPSELPTTDSPSTMTPSSIPTNATLAPGGDVVVKNSNLPSWSVALLASLLVIIVIACLTFWGCGYLHDKQLAYAEDRSAPNLILSRNEVNDTTQPLLARDVEANNHRP